MSAPRDAAPRARRDRRLRERPARAPRGPRRVVLLVLPPRRSESSAREPRQGSRVEPCFGGPMPIRALLIDDDTQARRAARARTSRPHDVASPTRPTAAAGSRRSPPGGVDIVVLDVMMPGLDGLDVLRRLRQQSAGAGRHAHGAGATRPTASSGSSSAPTTTSSKPVYPRELLARIRAVLRRMAPRERRPPAASSATSRSIPTSRTARIGERTLVAHRARVRSARSRSPSAPGASCRATRCGRRPGAATPS